MVQGWLRLVTDARRKRPWHFHYIPNKNFVNAFALHVGRIFVGEGRKALQDGLGCDLNRIILRIANGWPVLLDGRQIADGVIGFAHARDVRRIPTHGHFRSSLLYLFLSLEA